LADRGVPEHERPPREAVPDRSARAAISGGRDALAPRREGLTEWQARRLQRAGLAIAGIGILDVGYCVVSLARGESYSSSLNVFAVVAGILVYRGSRITARFAVRVLSFLIGVLLTLPVLVPILTPPRLLWLQLRSGEDTGFGAFAVIPVLLAVAFWLRKELAAVPVYAHGRFPPPLHRSAAAGVGVALSSGLVLLMAAAFLGPPGRRAVKEAELKVGPGYSFRVLHLAGNSARGGALVTAYSDTEIKNVEVEWGQE
jgi:hypothetical protein